MWRFLQPEPTLISERDALPGRDEPINPGELHAVFGDPIMRYDISRPENVSRLLIGMGCFWGAERLYWRQPGVVSTAVGYAGGYTLNPTYQEVCSGQTGHTEVVQVYFDTQVTTLSSLLKLFWESHDPTQGMRQGNDIGTQYRSALYWDHPEQETVIRESASLYQRLLSASETSEAMGSSVTTELGSAPRFYYAEEYHQQYLEKHPDGYCGLKGTGVACQI